MSVVKHFRELRVYREAFESAMQIFEYSKQWPKEERYSLKMGPNTDSHTHTLPHPQTRGRTTHPLQLLDETMVNPTTGAEFLTEI